MFCVYFLPAGQQPDKNVGCFKTKKAAKRYARRWEPYVAIRKKKSGLGRRRRLK